MKIKDIVKLMDEWAPFETAEDFDNVGLLVGDENEDVRGIVLALDVTGDIIEEAVTAGANLIITHHPTIFFAMKDITPYSAQGSMVTRLLQQNIALISAHTNLDMAEGGVSDALAEALGLINIKETDICKFMRVGELCCAMTPNEFAEYAAYKLCSDKIVAAGPVPDKIKTVCVMSGAGGSYLDEAKKVAADVFVTGEIHHEHAIAAHNTGIYVMAAGHYETEAVILPKIMACLQKACHDVQLSDVINITISGNNPFDIMV
jgi:dinuclear metal center YbgI/SA1388 family protein